MRTRCRRSTRRDAQRSDAPGVGDGRGSAAGSASAAVALDVVAIPGDRQIEITWTPTGTQPIAYRVLAADMAAGGVDAATAPYAPLQGQGLTRSLAFVDAGATNGQNVLLSGHRPIVCAAGKARPSRRCAPPPWTCRWLCRRVSLCISQTRVRAWPGTRSVAADLAGYRGPSAVWTGGGFAPVGGLMSGTLFEVIV